MYSEIDRLEEITKVMNDYLSRGDISVLRFCEVTKYSTKKFKHDLHYLKKQNKMALYYQVMAKIKKAEENKDQQLILDIFDILAIIKGLNGERGLSSMEFYCHTNYSIDEALLMAKRIFNTENEKLFKKYVEGLKNITVLSDYSIEALLENSHVLLIDGELTPIENSVKVAALNYLKTNSVPIAYVAINEACYRYYEARKEDKKDTK